MVAKVVPLIEKGAVEEGTHKDDQDGHGELEKGVLHMNAVVDEGRRHQSVGRIVEEDANPSCVRAVADVVDEVTCARVVGGHNHVSYPVVLKNGTEDHHEDNQNQNDGTTFYNLLTVEEQSFGYHLPLGHQEVVVDEEDH